MLMLSVLLSVQNAFAQDCNQIRRAVTKATPANVAGLYLKLAECDPNTARRIANTTMTRSISGDEGNAAAVAAVQVGAHAAASTWIEGLRSDERAEAIRAMGEACQESAEVQRYFIERAETMGDTFWSQRWYRALGACHAESIQGLLWSKLDEGMGGDRGQFFGVLEAYARSAEAAAVPKLAKLARDIDDPEADVNIVNAFADAAQVGSAGGMNQATAKKAVRTIVTLAPDLSPKGVEQARITLSTLLAEEESDKLAAIRYADAAQDDDTFLWGVIVSENADCKGGKKPMQRIHSAKVVDDGRTWADQVLDKVQASVDTVWALDLAARCKVDANTTYYVPNAPFADAEAYRAWVDETVSEITRAEVKRVIRMDQAPVRL
ncbi:MAG: hypothetical protein AAFV53_26945 [Myxococcota bacterium]